MAFYHNITVVGKTDSGKPIVRCFNREDNLRYAVGYFDQGVVAVKGNALTYRRLCEVKEGRIAKGSLTRKAAISINIEDDEED